VSLRPPHILHLIDHMGSGGAQRVILDLLEARDLAGAASVVSLRSHCLPELRKRLDACGASYRGLGLSRRNPLPLHRVARALRDGNADVVHTHLEFSNALGVVAARSLRRRAPAVIVHVHNDPVHHYSRLHRWAGRALASRTDAYITPSPSVERTVRETFGPGVQRVEVIPYGIDPLWFSREPNARLGSSLNGVDPVIGSVARLVAQKSLHDLIEAMPIVRQTRPGARLLIFGDGPLRSELEARSRRLGLAAEVTFAAVTHDLPAAYAALDVFVLPSRHEGLPICLLEVMAMGVPVVGTRVPGILDLVEDCVTGLAVPHGNPDALAGAVLRILSDAPLSNRLRAAARRRIEGRYTRDAVAARVEALYADLCATKRSAVGD